MKIIEYEWQWCKRGAIVEDNTSGFCIVDIMKENGYYCSKGEAYLWNLVVVETHRKLGIASSLLEYGEQYARENGCKRITLSWNRCDTEPFVLEWYKRKGYTVAKKTLTEITLEKTL